MFKTAGVCAAAALVAMLCATQVEAQQTGARRRAMSVAPQPRAVVQNPGYVNNSGRRYSYDPSDSSPPAVSVNRGALPAYVYVPGPGGYSSTASVRRGQTSDTFGLRPAGAKANGQY
jgi:hypothetical protein